MAHLKTTYPDPFTTTNYNFDVSGYGKRLHLHGENLNAVIVANFRVTELSMIPGFLHTGTWYDYFTGELVEVTDVNAFMDFAPGEYHVYLDANITAPNSTNVASVTNEASEFEVYPNPASHTVYGSIQLTNMQTCTLKVMDQVGKVIATQAIQPWHIGTHEFSLNVVQWPAGLYYIQCLHNGFSTTRQVIVD